MGLVAHAEKEIRKAGLFDEDGDYDGMIGDAVMELVDAFANQGHSGGSAHLTLDAFDRVVRFKQLTPITSDPSEWQDVTEYCDPDSPLWQSRRDPELFSNDGGQTWYNVDDGPDDVIIDHDTTDATVWARSWIQTITKYPDIPTDEGTMIGWFANALQCGEESGRHKTEVDHFGYDTYGMGV
jgi:hypothetical protein